MSSFLDKLKSAKEAHPIVKSLKEIGDERRVNPPEPEEQTEHTEPVPVEEPSKSKCPTCGKEFLHLSRHKCKGVQKEEEPEPTPPEEPKTAKDFDLYIDALVLSAYADEVSLFEFIKPVTDAIEKENDIPHWSMMEYAHGCGTLMRRVEKFIQKTKPTGIIYLDSSTKEGNTCKDVLKKYARRVVLGVKS
jgi:hypothetical protein